MAKKKKKKKKRKKNDWGKRRKKEMDGYNDFIKSEAEDYYSDQEQCKQHKHQQNKNN